MIIVKLIGGLGNQLFQYSVGRQIAYIHNTELKIDVSEFAHYKVHAYSLGAFNIGSAFSTSEEVEEIIYLSNNRIKNLLYKCINRSPNFYSDRYIKEKHFYFDQRINDLPNDIYLDGYWQSEKYFNNIKEILYDELTVKIEQQGKNKELNEYIKKTNSVSIHIRRGDYVNDAQTNSVHGTCGLNYYYKAIDYLTTKIDKPYFYIFSDDPKWVEENFKISKPCQFVSHNDSDKNYEDLRLMSACKHNIIANSTFSWWGAWLNQNPEKIIIAPKRWFRVDTFDVKDLIPKNWVTL